MFGGVDRAVERDGKGRSETAHQLGKGGAAGEAHVGGKARDVGGTQVVRLAEPAERGERDGRVDVIEEDGLANLLKEEIGSGDAVGEVGADHDDVGDGRELQGNSPAV